MSSINKPERATQDRVIKLFTDTLKYRYLGDWSDRAGKRHAFLQFNDRNMLPDAGKALALHQSASSSM
jgi:hypothetical protein